MTRILIIEDSKYQRNRIKNALKSTGFDFLEAENGKVGLDLAAVELPDCIILDMVMPEMSGVDVLQALQTQNRRIPVIVHTSDIQDGTRAECLALGAKAFLNKPLRDEELLAVVTEVVPAVPKEQL